MRGTGEGWLRGEEGGGWGWKRRRRSRAGWGWWPTPGVWGGEMWGIGGKKLPKKVMKLLKVPKKRFSYIHEKEWASAPLNLVSYIYLEKIMMTLILGIVHSLLDRLFAWPPIVYRSAGHPFCRSFLWQKSVPKKCHKKCHPIKIPQKLVKRQLQSLCALTPCHMGPSWRYDLVEQIDFKWK